MYTKYFTLIQVVGESFDENDENTVSKYYETMYALLDTVSPGYTQSFGEALIKKLSSVQEAVDGDADSNAPREEHDDETESWQMLFIHVYKRTVN